MVPASSNPYEWNRGYLGEKADFMSGGGALQTQLWITQDTYDWLFRKLVLKDPTAKGKRSVIGESETENRFISFSGFITKDNAVELDPWETYWDYAALEDSTGEYMVQAVDASGTVLASSEFDVQFFQVSTGRDLDSVYFDGLANFPESTAKFRIVKGGEVLAEIPVSSSDPVVSGVTPLSSTIMDGIQTITWSAVDAEGAPLTYSVSFNHDAADPESPWVILADGLDTQSFEQDFSLLEGDTGTHAKIRVTASDGLRSGYSESAYFTVHPKAPEVFINDLPENSELNDETGIAFSASVFDVHDQSFDQANIRWTSSLSGSLGTGSEILVKELAVGIHTITVTATNSAGLSGSDTVEVEVTEDAGSSQNSSGGMCFIETAYSGTQTDAWIMLPAVLTAFLILKKKTGFLLAKLLERINILE
jgi:hypothetical protein